jgi:hypothetical protein
MSSNSMCALSALSVAGKDLPSARGFVDFGICGRTETSSGVRSQQALLPKYPDLVTKAMRLGRLGGFGRP